MRCYQEQLRYQQQRKVQMVGTRRTELLASRNTYADGGTIKEGRRSRLRKPV